MSFFKRFFGKKTEGNDDQNEILLANESLKYDFQDTSSQENISLKNTGLPPKLVGNINRMMGGVPSKSTEDQEKQFGEELHESLKRYFSKPGQNLPINLTEPDGNVLKPHEAFDYTFSEWQKIRSKWDRMGLFFRQWDEAYLKKLNKWQVIERYNNDRLPVKALEYQTKNLIEDDYRDGVLLVALAKMNRLLSKDAKAREIIDFAYENLPDNHRVQVEYANILHLCGDKKEKEFAHLLINNIMEEKIKNSGDTTIGLLNFFCFSPDYIDSSIFAVTFLANGNASLDDWDRMSEEYYYCPVFRYEHAVKLSQSNDSMRALAKLNSLADEYPWYRTGVTATVDVILQFRKQRKDPAFMETEMKKLQHYLAVGDKTSR